MSQLDLHPASQDERRQAHGNVHDVWSRGLSVERLIARREQAPHHQFADWFVGCLDGKVVVSLAAHPFRFRCRGAIVPGIGIASVHTLPAFRGQGLAPRLLAWVEQHAAARGARLSLLFSDVDPGYYARLGYAACPAWEGVCALPSPAAEACAAPAWRLVAMPAAEALPELARLYDAFVAPRPLAVERYPAYWQNLLARRPHDEFYLVRDATDAAIGYVRLSPLPEPLWVTDPRPQTDRWKLSDYALVPGALVPDFSRSASDDELAQLFALVLRHAAERGDRELSGWLPKQAAVERCFALHPRAQEITMFKSLAPEWTLDQEMLAAADWLCEIDHV